MNDLTPPVVFDVDMTLTSEWFRDGKVEYLRANPPMVNLAKMLHSSGVPIVIATARREDLREGTEFWLNRNGILYSRLYMRAFDDYRHDPYVKRDQALEISSTWGRPLLWYDDNKEVCQVVKECGIPCIHVLQSGCTYGSK